jgi:DNA-binding Lrp family transcriptional regulator
VLVDGDNGIIAGHGRLAAARKLGLDQVPVIELVHLTIAQKRALVIADNRLALDAGWDEEMLALELAELSESGYELALTGFDGSELERLLAACPQVQQCYYVAGEWDFVLIFLVRSMDQYVELTRELFFTSGNVKSFNTLVAMNRVKTGSAVPVSGDVNSVQSSACAAPGSRRQAMGNRLGKSQP